MTEEEVYKVITKLIGEIKPVGESNEDSKRLDNVKTFIGVFDRMHTDIDDIAWVFKSDKRASVKKIVDACSNHLDKIGIIS